MQVNLSEFEAGRLATAIITAGEGIAGSKDWVAKPTMPMLIARANEVGGTDARDMRETIPAVSLLLETLKVVLMKLTLPCVEVRNEVLH